VADAGAAPQSLIREHGEHHLLGQRHRPDGEDRLQGRHRQVDALP
jgi:hypothetical protein